MSIFWSYFLPVIVWGLLMGGVPGVIWLRRKRALPLLVAAAVVVAGAALWHGPLGGADRLAMEVERSARSTLAAWEMGQVQAKLHRSPLSRRLLLSGPADEFQRTQLVRIMGEVPGVSRAVWDGSGGIPLLVEAAVASLLGFLVGLFVAYVVELRRRYNAEWKW